MTTTHILTPSWNKGPLLAEAGRSVLAQTRGDWRWTVVLNGATSATKAAAAEFSDPRIRVIDWPVTTRERGERFLPSVIFNQYFGDTDADYLAWLSDDDVLEPCYVEVLAGYLDEHPEVDVCYGRCEVVRWLIDRYVHRNWLYGTVPIGAGTGINPNGTIDGGQILVRRSAYERLKPWKLREDWDAGSILDGYFMEALVRSGQAFHPIDHKVLTHRCTPLSTFDQGGI